MWEGGGGGPYPFWSRTDAIYHIIMPLPLPYNPPLVPQNKGWMR